MELDIGVLLGLNNIEEDVGESRLLFGLNREGEKVSICGPDQMLHASGRGGDGMGEDIEKPAWEKRNNNNNNGNGNNNNLPRTFLSSSSARRRASASASRVLTSQLRTVEASMVLEFSSQL